MPPLLKHKTEFLREVGSCRLLYRHCLTPRGAHSDAGVEAAFLQMYKAWESLLEECTLAYMCGRLRCDGTLVASHTTSRDEEWARKAMYQERRYLEWDVERAVIRWQTLFPMPNLLEAAIRPAKTELKHMSTIRNAIAHSSMLAMRKFGDLVQSEFGGRRRMRRAAELLSAAWPQDTQLTFFDRYADVLETVAPGVTG